MKKKILAILQLPPPVGGVTVINQSIANSPKIQSLFVLDILPIQFSKQMKQIGKFRPFKIFLFLKLLSQTTFKLIFNRYQLVYFTLNLTGFALWRDLIFVCLFKLFRQKCLYHLHGRGMRSNYQNSFLRIYQFIFKKSDVILISPLLINEMESFLKSSKIHYLLNGITPSLSENQILEAIQKRQENKISTIFFLGHLWTLKGCYILLEALSLLNQENIDFNCIFAGTVIDIDPENFQKRILELKLEKKVSYVGPVYGEEKIKHFLESDIFAYPTLNDSFGLVLVEAMEAGLPVIASHEGAIPEIVQDTINGFIVPKQDVKILAHKLLLLIKDKNTRTLMGEESRKIFLERFTFNHFEENLIKIFMASCMD